MVDYALTVMVQNDFGHIFSVKLPEDPYVLDDILANNQVFTGRDCRIDDVKWMDFPDIVIHSTDDVAELNYIAIQFTRHGYDEDRYTSILQALGGGSHRAVDLATHFDSLSHYTDIHTYRDLGIAFLKGRVDKDPLLSYSDHYLIECGRYAKTMMGGIFLENGEFVGFPKEFLHQSYDGHCLPDHGKVRHPFITMNVTKRHVGLPPQNIPEQRNRQGPVVVSNRLQVKLPLSSSAATIYRNMARLGLDPYSLQAQQDFNFVYTPIGEQQAIVRGSIGQVAEAALCYEQMSLVQRQAFRDMLVTAQQQYEYQYFLGRGKPVPNSGTLMWNERVLERMESEHGFVRPSSKNPVCCLVRNKRLPEMPQKAIFPLSTGEMHELIDNLALDSSKDPNFQVVTFSLDSNCGSVQRLVDQGITMEGFNQNMAALIDEPEPNLQVGYGMGAHQL